MFRRLFDKIDDIWYATEDFRKVIGKIPLLLIILILILLFNFFNEKYQFKENRPEIIINKTLSLKTGMQSDEQKVLLHEGDTVSLLGYVNTSSLELGQLFVETKDGLRGYVFGYELGYPVVREKERDTVVILKSTTERISQYALIRCADGQEIEFSKSKLNVIYPDEFIPFELGSERDCYLSENKFKNLYVGKALQECDSLIMPSLFVNKKKDGTYESYFDNLNVFNLEDGLFHMPILYADADMIVQDYEFVKTYGNNSFFLKRLPYVEKLIDCDFFARIIASPFYAIHYPFGLFEFGTEPEGWHKVLGWIIVIFYMLFGILWALCTEAILILFMRLALQWRWSFYICNNEMVKILFALAAIASTYVWFVLILTYGLTWIVAWIVIPVSYFLYRYATKQLKDTIPHERCPECKRIGEIILTKTNLVDEYDKWETECEKGDLLSSKKIRVGSHHTEITYSDGHVEKHDNYEDYKIENEYKIKIYEVCYHIKIYEDIYTCICGYSESSERSERRMISKKYIGESTTTETSDFSEFISR